MVNGSTLTNIMNVNVSAIIFEPVSDTHELPTDRHEAYYKSVTDQTLKLPNTDTTVSLLANEEVNVEVSYKVRKLIARLLSLRVNHSALIFCSLVLRSGCSFTLRVIRPPANHALDRSNKSVFSLAP